MSKGKTKDKMDGAFFPWDEGKTPADFLDGPDGFREGQKMKPSGMVKVMLNRGVDEHKVLSPRWAWKQGHWKETTYKTGDDWNTWVVTGEGTPGNYKERHFVLPDEMAGHTTPKHPADWPTRLKEKPKEEKWKSTASVSSGLPWGLRIRCIGCGHFYKPSDLGDHAKNACPAAQGDPAMWVIACECHENDLQAAATVLPGFPVTPPQQQDQPLAEDLQEEASKSAPDNVRGKAEAYKGD